VNRAQALVACQVCGVVTATLRILYVFVALDVGSHRPLSRSVFRFAAHTDERVNADIEGWIVGIA
jgi:hypothetical protein